MRPAWRRADGPLATPSIFPDELVGTPIIVTIGSLFSNKQILLSVYTLLSRPRNISFALFTDHFNLLVINKIGCSAFHFSDILHAKVQLIYNIENGVVNYGRLIWILSYSMI
jgi:hypothetical protein